MSTTITSIASTLNALIETCKDGQGVFHTAAENVKNEDFKLLFTDLEMQRRYFTGELQRLVQNLGQNAATIGRFPMGSANLKAAMTKGDDHAILAECERVDDAAVAEYQEALEQQGLPINVRTVVQHQAMGVKAAHDRVRHLRDRFQD